MAHHRIKNALSERNLFINFLFANKQQSPKEETEERRKGAGGGQCKQGPHFLPPLPRQGTRPTYRTPLPRTPTTPATITNIQRRSSTNTFGESKRLLRGPRRGQIDRSDARINAPIRVSARAPSGSRGQRARRANGGQRRPLCLSSSDREGLPQLSPLEG